MSNAASQQALLEIRNLNFQYGAEKVLTNLNLRIDSGEYLGLLGPNGSGKSTLIRLILGLMQPTSGQIIWHQTNLEQVGYVPQRISQTALDSPLNVTEIITSALIRRPIWPNRLEKQRIASLLKTLSIEDLAQRQLSQLSGGQRKRVFMARALVNQPKLLILDEPTIGVDGPSEAQFFNCLAELHRQQALTIILISHDLDSIAQAVSRVIFLNHKILADGPPAAILSDQLLTELFQNKQSLSHQHHQHPHQHHHHHEHEHQPDASAKVNL